MMPTVEFLTEVLGDVPASGSRSWFEVLESRWDKAEDAVRERLAGAGTSRSSTVRSSVRSGRVDGLVGTMFRWRELTTHRRGIRAPADRVEREMPGLRKALSYAIAVRRGG